MRADPLAPGGGEGQASTLTLPSPSVRERDARSVR
jgi:hypothetical protein